MLHWVKCVTLCVTCMPYVWCLLGRSWKQWGEGGSKYIWCARKKTASIGGNEISAYV